MAYYSGQASSYQELLNVLVTACVAQGWTWADGILSKEETFVKLSVSASGTTAQGPGIILQGGVGKSGTNLTTPSTAVRLGPDAGVNPLFSFIFPLAYQIFIFDNPNEVFLIVNYEIDKFSYLAFGQSTGSGYKTWIEASVAVGFQTSSNASSPISITQSTGGYSSGNLVHAYPSGFFWQTTDYGGRHHCGLYSIDTGWIYPLTGYPTLSAIQAVYNLVQVSPPNWSSESILIPIIVVANKSSNKCAIATIINNARYIRVDNLEPDQILTLGSEKWKVFPFFKKNSSVRNGGNNIVHTGTFGWAIRYDGT